MVQCRDNAKARERVGRKAGSKNHIPSHEREAARASDSKSTADKATANEDESVEAVKLQPGSKLKIISDIQRYLENPDVPMVSDGLVGRLASTRNMNVAPNKMYEDDGHKVDVIRFIAAKCAVSLPPATPAELHESLEAFFVFCGEQRVPPTIGLFSVWNGVTQQRYDQITRDMNDPARANAFANAKELIRSFLELAAMENDINPLIYFHQNKTMYGLVENQQVTLRVEDNARELTVEEREARMRSLEAIPMVQDDDGTWYAP